MADVRNTGRRLYDNSPQGPTLVGTRQCTPGCHRRSIVGPRLVLLGGVGVLVVELCEAALALATWGSVRFFVELPVPAPVLERFRIRSGTPAYFGTAPETVPERFQYQT